MFTHDFLCLGLINKPASNNQEEEPISTYQTKPALPGTVNPWNRKSRTENAETEHSCPSCDRNSKTEVFLERPIKTNSVLKFILQWTLRQKQKQNRTEKTLLMNGPSICNYNGNIGHFEFMQNIKLKQFSVRVYILCWKTHVWGHFCKKIENFCPTVWGWGGPK